MCAFIVFSPVNNPVWILFRHTHLCYHYRDSGTVKLRPLCEQLLDGGLKTTKYVNFYNDNIKVDPFWQLYDKRRREDFPLWDDSFCRAVKLSYSRSKTKEMTGEHFTPEADNSGKTRGTCLHRTEIWVYLKWGNYDSILKK